MISQVSKRRAIQAELRHGGRIERVHLIEGTEPGTVVWVTATFGRTAAPAGQAPATYEDLAPEWLCADMRALSLVVLG
jgi:hypothetical protein